MNKDYLKRLMETFQPEAEEYLKVISLGLVEYEKCRDDEQKIHIIEQVYRATHSLKGAARAVDLLKIEQICQNVEDVFAAFKEQKIKESTSLFDDLHKGIDLISAYLSIEDDEKRAEISSEIDRVIIILSEQIENE